jgi:tRNA(Ile)-lysidine synthase
MNLQQFTTFINQKDLFNPKDKLLLAVSGGVDSVVLCELCKQAGFNFAIAHCNFRLREKESERDKEFVSGLAKKYNVEFFLKEFDTEKFAKENKLSIQEAARKLRYDWFYELLAAHGSQLTARSSQLSTLLTAHHADDNIETVLMNFFRGTGLQGLAGIPVKSPDGKICRPLLGFWKEELIAFAKENKLDFVEDSSNLSTKYTRNLFRQEIIPLIAKVYPEAKQNLLHNIERFDAINDLYKISVGDIKKKLLKKKGNEIHVPIKQLMGYNNRALIFDIISDFGFGEKYIDEVIKLAESDSGKYIESPSTKTRVIKFRNWFIISTSEPKSTGTIVIEEGIRNLELGVGSLELAIRNLELKGSPNSQFPISNSPSIACVDADLISYPLIIRRWKAGDYFYPLGMKKKKKLARFFIDQKLSRTEKENVWVIEMNMKILWVVGRRIDDRFKITDKTRKILQITLNSYRSE